MMLEKLATVEVQPRPVQEEPEQIMTGAQTKDVLSQMQEAAKAIPDELTESTQATRHEVFTRSKAVIESKEYTLGWQQKETALAAMQDCFENATELDLMSNEAFVTECTILLRDSLETNNMQVYTAAVQVAGIFLDKTIQFECVKDALKSFVKAIVLHTTDTNTRVRKKSVDLINQLWSKDQSSKHPGTKGTEDLSNSSIIASVLTDPSLQEKAIVGRLGLFIKRALLIVSGDDLNKLSHHLMLGRDYEQLTEFACSWCLHKNTKVRQCALKLIVEVCRVNHIDPRGAPFKQRIVNYILALRPSLKDPLVAKINEVCALEENINTSNEEAPKKRFKQEDYINLNLQELSMVNNTRSQSLDVRRGVRQAPQVNRTLI
jgi:hypothetical protein